MAPQPSKLMQISRLSGWKLRDQSSVLRHSKSCHSTLTPSLEKLPKSGRHSPSISGPNRLLTDIIPFQHDDPNIEI